MIYPHYTSSNWFEGSQSLFIVFCLILKYIKNTLKQKINWVGREYKSRLEIEVNFVLAI